MTDLRKLTRDELETSAKILTQKLQAVITLFQELNPDVGAITVYNTVTQKTKVGSAVIEELRKVDREIARRNLVENPVDDVWTR